MKLKDTEIVGNLNVTEDVQIGDMSVTEELTKLNSNLKEVQTKTNGIHTIIECGTSKQATYDAFKYISLYQDDTDTSSFNDEMVSFTSDGLITINQDMDILVNICFVGRCTTNDDSRLWYAFKNYTTGKVYRQYIVCNTTYATGITTIALKGVTAGTQFGIQLYSSFELNVGLSGSYIQIIKL